VPKDLPTGFCAFPAHAVESTVIGEYTDSGALVVTWEGKTCACIDLDLLTKGFPQWEFDACWTTPEERGLTEPVLGAPEDYNRLLESLLASPNICSKRMGRPPV
jgi:phosphoribosylformylglycinamidine (FGAM) synthase-like enzyme